MAAASSKALAIIAAIFIPPLGVAIHSGINKEFWICLVLTVLFFLPGFIYALIIILS